MQVIRSNQLEALVDELARIVRERPLPPHASEMIVVPGTAMRQWLPLELARRLGIWAHASLPSPRAALQTLCNRALGRPENQSDVFDAHELKWAVASTLHELRGDERLRDINHYIDDADRLLRFSSRVAQLFDRYVVYRPQLVLGWERREADGWQPLLWRRLIERHGSQHLAARIQEVGRLGDRPANAALPLPERIMLFGIDSLPPLFLQGFTHLSHLIETTLFNPSPTAEYWGDLRPKRELFRGAQGQLPFVDPADAGNDAEIHPLLASLGRSAREFHEQLSELQHEDCNRFVRPHQPTKLHSLQRSFLTLVANEQSMWRKEDASVQVHRCTNAWREVQVLYDHLRDFLEQDPTLEPHDITVVIPDLDAYESIVEAVFSEVPTPDEQMAHPIPYQLPNSRRDAERVFINHVSAVFKTLQGQLRVADVLDVLTIPTLAAEFQFDHSERELIGRLLAQAAVDWGADAKHRAQLGAAEDATHSWEAGLQRLLLALLLPSDRRRVFEQTVATAIDAEQASTVLPRLMTCIDHINRARAQTKGTRTVAQWASIVDGIIADLFTKSETTSSGYELINATQATLLARSHRAGFEAELTFDSYTRELLNAISASRGARSRANGVRFCTAEPVNLLPARVVCFLGLSE